MSAAESERPDIYRFHDYREFLKSWLDHLRKTEKVFSLRALSAKAGLANGYLPMILAGTRHLSMKALQKMAPELGLSRPERSYLEILVQLGTSDSQAARMEALERMRKFRSYRELNPKEIEVHRYLTRWYYVAIREMALMRGFQADPRWIQSRLREKVPLKEIKEAVEFLISNGFLVVGADGSVRPPEKDIDCLGGVYRVALAQFHKEMFGLASRSIENTPSAERSIFGHTFAVDAGNFEKARAILAEALEKIRALGPGNPGPDSVYHAELAFFPLTKKE